MDGDIEIQILEKLGKGGFGTVFKARDLRSGKTVAVKVIKLDKNENKDIGAKLDSRLMREIEAMDKLKNVSRPTPS